MGKTSSLDWVDFDVPGKVMRTKASCLFCSHETELGFATEQATALVQQHNKFTLTASNL